MDGGHSQIEPEFQLVAAQYMYVSFVFQAGKKEKKKANPDIMSPAALNMAAPGGMVGCEFYIECQTFSPICKKHILLIRLSEMTR